MHTFSHSVCSTEAGEAASSILRLTTSSRNNLLYSLAATSSRIT